MTYFYTGDKITLGLSLSESSAGPAIKVVQISLSNPGVVISHIAPSVPFTIPANGSTMVVITVVAPAQCDQGILNFTTRHLPRPSAA